jgi:chloramphenicol-sensitive protein RarD
VRLSKGALSAVAAYGIWGFLPIYWKQVAQVPSLEILSHRIVWSLLFFAVILAVLQPSHLSLRRHPARVWRAYLLSGWLIGLNWLLFIWAVTHGHVLQSSLGYFLSPLGSVAIGALFFGEHLGMRQRLAVVLAAAGALVLLRGAASDLWIALALTLTFCLYGVARRLAPLPSLQGMYLETLLLAPLGLTYFGWAATHGQFCLPQVDQTSQLLLLGAGPVTGVPLLFFSKAARRLTLAQLGMFQYISPSLQFLLALHYHEQFTPAHALAFGLIWTGLLIYASATRSTILPRVRRA